jgi:NDP-sugar pyrophosphorylase family protein
LSWGDIIVPPGNYQAIMSRYHNEDCDGVLTVNWMEDPYEGAAVYAEDGCVTEIIEKPPKGESTTHFNNAGIFVLPAEIFGALKKIPVSERGELEAPDAIMHIIEHSTKLLAHEIEGYRYDVARPSALLELNADMLQALFDDATAIADGAEVSDAAEIEPPVYIGCEAKVGEARVGPNAVIGSGCTIGDGATLEHAACFSGSSVGEGASARYAIVNHGAVLPSDYELGGSEDMPACLSRRDVR